jgi:methylated-DNA-protein-cysteine methyltransferase-like protein
MIRRRREVLKGGKISGVKPAPPTNYERIYAVVERIPEGRVATYGQVAALAGLGRAARQVGYALHSLPDGSDLPWHRVINSRGEVSPRAMPGWDGYQRHLLEEEGVELDERGRVDLERYRWEPPPARKRKRPLA